MQADYSRGFNIGFSITRINTYKLAYLLKPKMVVGLLYLC